MFSRDAVFLWQKCWKVGVEFATISTAKWFKGTEKKPQIPIIAEDFAIAIESSAK